MPHLPTWFIKIHFSGIGTVVVLDGQGGSNFTTHNFVQRALKLAKYLHVFKESLENCLLRNVRLAHKGKNLWQMHKNRNRS